MVNNPVWEICERVAEVQAPIDLGLGSPGERLVAAKDVSVPGETGLRPSPGPGTASRRGGLRSSLVAPVTSAKEFDRHETINHSADEYVRGDAHPSIQSRA
jgi:hypothetical protein